MPNEHLVGVRLKDAMMQALVREAARQSVEAGRPVSLPSIVRKAINAYLPPPDTAPADVRHRSRATGCTGRPQMQTAGEG